MAVHALQQGKTLFDMLMDIYLEYGLYREGWSIFTVPAKADRKK
jgi:hypothetical protein